MLSEQDVDRELKVALSVSPSPDFEARVLQRVHADRPARWPARYRWLAAAASLVIVAGAFYALKRPSPVVEQAPAPQIVRQTAPQPSLPPLPPPHEAPVHNRANAGVPARVEAVRVARRAPRTTEPEVIVPLNQMAAVRRLVQAVNEGRVEVPAQPPSGPMAPPPAITLTPVAVQPIPLAPLGPAVETAAPFILRLN